MMDHGGHTVDSSLRHHGSPTDSRRAGAGTAAASSLSRRPPNDIITWRNLNVSINQSFIKRNLNLYPEYRIRGS